MTLEFATAGRIVFGNGRVQEAGEHARALGRSALLVTGKNPARAEDVRRLVLARGISVTVFSVDGEPTLEVVKEGAAQTKIHTNDLVIGIGGGSVLDAAKAIAALATNRRPTLDYLEVIGRGLPLESKPLPTIMIPTTAGTGSEVTRNAVLISREHKAKVSLRHHWMLPTVALVDPQLTRSVPKATRAATGLDALSQLIEPFVCARANPLTDGFCREGISLAARSLRRVVQNAEDAEAREQMSMASVLGGLSLANAGLGAVHGFAGPLGALFNAPHGALCAILLPHVMRANLRAGKKDRFEEVARRLSGNPAASAEDGVRWVETLVKDLGIAGLGKFGVTPAHFPDIIEKARNASSMKANPVELSEGELEEILQRSL